jgi:hypothetical protein
MRIVFTTLIAATILGSAALAQSTAPNAPAAPRTPPSDNAHPSTGSSNRAVNPSPAGSPERTGSVQPGANSFTEGQARSRIEAHGFSNVSDLHRDDQGIWRGRAMRNGQSVNVMLDYKGDVASQ